ncbi:MAG: hypothetical protein SPJ19_05765 [Candidatus Borkfalkiaceae bacterium]|nr:hypothetical protein [Christensenellaceae bacterium]
MNNFVKKTCLFIFAITVLTIFGCFSFLSPVKNTVKAEELIKLEKTLLNAETFVKENKNFNFYGKISADDKGERVIISDGATAETKGETKFFNLFAREVKSKRLRISFGEGYAEIDAENKIINLSVGGKKTETALGDKVDLSEYFVYVEVENGSYTETVVNDRYVLTYAAGGIKIGIAGAVEAEYKIFDIAAKAEITEFSYGKISIEAFGGEASFGEIKIFPLDTGYEIDARDYDANDDKITREEKPERLTDKQIRQKTKVIVLISVGGAVAAGLFVTVIVIIVKNARRKGGKI